MTESLVTETEKIIILFLMIILIYILQKLIQYLLSVAIRRNPGIALDDVINGIRVMTRLASGIAIIYTILFLYELPVEVIIGISTLIGAIISFSSIQTIQNFIAGLFILITRPFGIKDFVCIDNQEGIVTEISLNYTKLRTTDNEYTFIPNKRIVGASIINYSVKVKTEADFSKADTRLQKIKLLKDYLVDKEIVRYSFQWGAPLGNLWDAKERITEVCRKYASKFDGYIPQFFLYTVSHRMEFKFIVTVDDPVKIIDHVNDFRDEVAGLFH